MARMILIEIKEGEVVGVYVSKGYAEDTRAVVCDHDLEELDSPGSETAFKIIEAAKNLQGFKEIPFGGSIEEVTNE